MMHFRFINYCYCWDLTQKGDEEYNLLRKRKRRLQCKAP
ncbi:MAG: hypothetical protein K0R76_1391 [Alphaproteobacteria bacterium]|jgi:hypothetical protein|nr:hypothetical protein [Alphaproteobacteria bacterium]MDF3034437.1 hypothetical protein [Alphaproteobacteria bacterium]